MPPRLSPVDRIRAQIDDLFASEQDLGQVLEQVARLSVRLVMQAAVEAEVSEFLGRDRYARGERERAGYRNGHAELTVKTTAGPVVLERPKLRGTTEPFASRLLSKGVSRTNALEALVLSGFVRGLSVRDVEAALAEALGPEAALSKSTVSRICEAIKDEFDAWKTRDLSGIELEYLFLDGSHLRMHPGAPAEPVLAAWGITTQGAPVLVGLAPGASEGHDPWAGFLGELVDRGLRAPLLVITDGAAGLVGAVELVFANSLRQRCLVHRARNTLAKVSVHDQAEVKADFWAVFDVDQAEPGEEAVAAAHRQAAAFAAKWQARYPAAVACVTVDLASLTVHLRFPREHWARIRHTNLIERTFGETRRRVKVVGRLPRGAQLPVAGVGGAGPSLAWLAWGGHDPGRRAAAAGSTPPAPPPARGSKRRWSSSLSPLPHSMPAQEPAPARFSTISGTPPRGGAVRRSAAPAPAGAPVGW